MEKIKYKLWLYEEKMYLDDFYILPCGSVGVIKHFGNINEFITLNPESYELIPSTTLHDQSNNKIEMYHGDIYLYSTEDGLNVMQVLWVSYVDDERFSPYPQFIDTYIAEIDPDNNPDFDYDSHYCTVIGNMFEHPHLLNKDYYENFRQVK